MQGKPGPAPKQGGPEDNPPRTKPDQRLPRHMRLTRVSSFREAYAQNRRWVSRTFST